MKLKYYDLLIYVLVGALLDGSKRTRDSEAPSPGSLKFVSSMRRANKKMTPDVALESLRNAVCKSVYKHGLKFLR